MKAGELNREHKYMSTMKKSSSVGTGGQLYGLSQVAWVSPNCGIQSKSDFYILKRVVKRDEKENGGELGRKEYMTKVM